MAFDTFTSSCESFRQESVKFFSLRHWGRRVVRSRNCQAPSHPLYLEMKITFLIIIPVTAPLDIVELREDDVVVGELFGVLLT